MKEFKGFKKGIDLGGWLSQCDYSKERLEGFIVENDIKTIAEWGADHVRLPIDFNILEDGNGGYSDIGFGYVKGAVDMCFRHGLNIVIDIHKTAGFSFDQGEQESGFFDSEELQERFYRLWEEIARRFNYDTERIAFELLNEVTDRSFSKTWNRVTKECIRRIRAIAPDTVILVGSYWNNSVSAVKDLDPPYDDKVVYNFHCYDPLMFTHQHAYWVPAEMGDVNKDMSYEESGATPEYFEKLFAEAIKVAEENSTVLYCGEYGVIDKASPEDILAWYKAINAVFEKYNIGRCTWTYKEMDFGLSDKRLDGVREELLKYI
ncbi:MAG: glycoside hydrolase family 5 protein [Ruminiclostridium sp.]|nr:glycoside hydrolase family 5 protein [Ruminiclostridium sp.]